MIKRPLLRPAIPSPYAGAQQQKVVYISTKTAFLGAVKRVEKLLHLSDKRLVQSATTIVKHANGKRKRNTPAGGRDDILEAATEVERQKAKRRRKAGDTKAHGDDEDAVAGEEVVIKGTGRAIAKVLEMALWFQQRDDWYSVRMTTGTVRTVDDIEVEEPAMPVEEEREYVHGEVASPSKNEVKREDSQVPVSRSRFTSVLEVAVSML